jgi:hypothetical protein
MHAMGSLDLTKFSTYSAREALYVRLTRRRTKCGRWLVLQLQLTEPSRLPIVASATALFQTGGATVALPPTMMKLQRRR